jgi:hypothetical protein
MWIFACGQPRLDIKFNMFRRFRRSIGAAIPSGTSRPLARKCTGMIAF